MGVSGAFSMINVDLCGNSIPKLRRRTYLSKGHEFSTAQVALKF